MRTFSGVRWEDVKLVSVVIPVSPEDIWATFRYRWRCYRYFSVKQGSIAGWICWCHYPQGLTDYQWVAVGHTNEKFYNIMCPYALVSQMNSVALVQCSQLQYTEQANSCTHHGHSNCSPQTNSLLTFRREIIRTVLCCIVYACEFSWR